MVAAGVPHAHIPSVHVAVLLIPLSSWGGGGTNTLCNGRELSYYSTLQIECTVAVVASV